MTSVVDMPGDAAIKMQRLRRAGHCASVVLVATWPIQWLPCRACDTNECHPAHVIVNIVFDTVEYTEPIYRLDGYSTPCCWAGLAPYLDEVEHQECFAGVTIEVPE